MYEQLNDIPYLLVKERLVDLEHEAQTAQISSETPGRLLTLWFIFDDHLGDLLIRLGEGLKHHRPYPPQAHHV